MLRVGLSGGIGSGKSTVAQRFSELGAVVIDADVLAREVVAAGSDGLGAIVERFGDEVLEGGGTLNRAALGAIVFADPQARGDLERITHPRIAARTKELISASPDDAVIVHDVPLLVEKHLGPGYHLVVIVSADAETRLKRLMQTRGMTEQNARDRMAAQASDDERRAAADVWLDNSGSRDALVEQVDALWRNRLVPFEQNVRSETRVKRPERLEVADHDPSWPAQGQRLLERLRLAFGEDAVTAHHVGSTSVPGLPAKDVLDLQIGVRSLEATDDDGLLARTTAAGFPRAEGVWTDIDRGSGGEWPKRMHGSSDPGRVAHVHVREAGSAGWRWALLFRDWMRADESARAEYAELKRRLVHQGLSTTAYAEAKEPWFTGIAGRAEHWARQTGWRPPTGAEDD
jgi:dephospho-CoA kinase